MTKQELLDYVKQEYGTEPEYLWEKSPDAAALRHVENQKWYGVLLAVKYHTLGLNGDKMVDILDLKCDSEKIDFIRQIKGVFPGYHMNKSHWVTVLLDGTTDDNLIKNLLEESYTLTLSKRKNH